MGDFCDKCGSLPCICLMPNASVGERREAQARQVGGEHYKKLAIEPMEFCQRNGLHYAESNAIKYICRHKLKGGKEDIEKAIHCLEMLLEMEYEVC